MRSTYHLLLVTAFLLAAAAAFAEHPVATAQRVQREAAAAYQAGDFAAFVAALERARALNPASYATLYNLACGYALTGREAEALDLLEQLTAARIDYGMADDPDLASLRDSPRFRMLVDTLAANIVPVSNSTERLIVDRLDLMPEGIALDAGTGRLFFGSMRSGTVYATGPDETWSKFATVGDRGAYSAIGMTVDAARGILWVVATHFFLAEGFDADDRLPSGLVGFDLATGERRHEYLAPADVEGLNDVAVAPNGDVYVSGSTLFVLEAGTDALAPVGTQPALFGSNGLTVTPDGRTLFVSSYPVGIAALDLDTGRLVFLDSAPGEPLYGVDGLYWHRGRLLAIQNGIQPWRLLSITVDTARTRVTGIEIVEFANPDLLAMTGAPDGDSVHYVGRGPAPAERPAHFPDALAPQLGRTVIMTARLPAAAD